MNTILKINCISIKKLISHVFWGSNGKQTISFILQVHHFYNFLKSIILNHCYAWYPKVYIQVFYYHYILMLISFNYISVYTLVSKLVLPFWLGPQRGVNLELRLMAGETISMKIGLTDLAFVWIELIIRLFGLLFTDCGYSSC